MSLYYGVGVIPPLCDLLTCNDIKCVLVVLDGISAILSAGNRRGENKYNEYVEECGGLDNIEALQSHANDKVYEAAIGVLQTHFVSATDDTKEEEFVFKPAVVGDIFKF